MVSDISIHNHLTHMVKQNTEHVTDKEACLEVHRKQRKWNPRTVQDNVQPLRIKLKYYFRHKKKIPAPTFYCFFIMSSHYESLKGLIHSMGQSPYHPIITGNTLTDTPKGVLY